MRLALFLLRGIVLGLFAMGALVRAGIAPFTDPGKIDFDTAIQMVNPYGTWSQQADGKWAFTPLSHAAPYTNGRWLYTEYGWFWKGNAPESWLTEHYGYWKRSPDKVWMWYPGPLWLPQIVEIRASPAGIGWRSAEVDRDGNFVESPADRFTKTDEWTFVTPKEFAMPLTPDILPKGAAAEQLLEQSTESVHSYLTYREIDRPGPHPADFVNLGDGLMFAPMTEADKAKAVRPLAVEKDAAKKKLATTKIDPATAARIAASLTASEDIPDIPQQPGAQDPNDDPRQVRYWVTMCLPTPWTKPPADAKDNEIYIYRPDFYQDQDGIQRRVAYWLNPGLRAAEALHLQDVLKHHAPLPAANGTGTAAVPAAPSGGGFASPFDETYDSSPAAAKASTKPNVNMAGAPVNQSAPTTNAPPAAAAPDSLAPSSIQPSVPGPAPDGRASPK